MGVKLNNPFGAAIESAEITDGSIVDADVNAAAAIAKTKFAAMGTNGRNVKFDASGLPADGTNTDADVADAVTKKHTQGTDQALDTGGANEATAANVKDAVTKKHAHSPVYGAFGYGTNVANNLFRLNSSSNDTSKILWEVDARWDVTAIITITLVYEWAANEASNRTLKIDCGSFKATEVDNTTNIKNNVDIQFDLANQYVKKTTSFTIPANTLEVGDTLIANFKRNAVAGEHAYLQLAYASW